jgi:hypothetical protein
VSKGIINLFVHAMTWSNCHWLCMQCSAFK